MERNARVEENLMQLDIWPPQLKGIACLPQHGLSCRHIVTNHQYAFGKVDIGV